MKRLNLYCLIGGLLLVLIGTVRVIHFFENPTMQMESNKIAQGIGMSLIPLFGLLMLIESIRRFKLEP